MRTRSQTSAKVIVPNVEGHRIIKSGLHLDKARFYNMLKPKDLQVVFNPDKRRLQVRVPVEDQDIELILDVLRRHEILQGRHVSDVVVLHSKSQCRAQYFHTDFPDQVRFLREKPLSVLYALENDTKIYTRDECIKISKGDILIWDGDLVHAGGNYEQENTRIHFYLDTSMVKRSMNTTYNLSDDTLEEIC
jgi:hypothetical protein